MVINDLSEDTGHVNEFSIIINNELTRLDEIEFALGTMLVTPAVTPPSISPCISLDNVMRVAVVVVESK